MSLTRAHAPLSGSPAPGNYALDGPPHKLLFEPFPRRIRAVFAGRTILDTTRAKLLHETGLLPVVYAPLEDFAEEALEPTDHSTHCPFKGDASYFSLRADGRVSENAVWTYREPLEAAPWLAGHAAAYWHKADVWLEEEEEVRGHVRDPYTRVDTRASSRPVEVVAGGEVLAATTRPVLLFETGLPVRAYVPRDDVRGALEPSEKRTWCPYKGEATYWSVRRADGTVLSDAAWSYETGDLLDDGPHAVAGMVSFHDDGDVEVRIGP